MSVIDFPVQSPPVAAEPETPQGVDEAAGREEIARLLANAPDHEVLFKGIMEVVGRFVEFDWANLFLFTEGREYSRIVYQHCRPGNRDIEYQSRWFPTPASYRDWILKPETWVDDLEPYIRKGPDADELLARQDLRISIAAGVKGLVCLPVQECGKVKGGLCLQSRQEAIYGAKDREALERLMLNQALLPLFHAAELAEREFVIKLVDELAASSDFKEIAQTAVKEIADSYGFQNVSIFKVNALRGHFKLMAQALAPDGGKPMPEGYTQPLGQGLLGLTYERGKPVLLGDAKGHSPEAQIYVATAPDMRSELCIPIEMSGRILWILNVEDRHTDAFTRGEVETLERIIEQMQSNLKRIFQRLILMQVLDVVPATVVITEESGTVMHATKDALRMFERDTTGDNLSRFLSRFSELGRSPTPTKVVGEHGKETSVLAQKFTLEDEYDHNVVVLQDVTELQWEVDREHFKAALAETAAQVRVPVSLLSSFLRQIGHKPKDKDVQDLTRKALRQLDRIELTYDRVLLACNGTETLPTAHEAPLDVNLVLDHILSELPRLERRAVKRSTVNGQAMVKADPYRVLFALNSMTAYLLRSRTNAESIIIKVRTLKDAVEVSMTGAVQQTTPLGELAVLVETARTQIALGADTLAQLAAACGGTFERRTQVKGRERLSLRLPAAT
jgi:putative methionine-R-sulfoxide reductase with GAF domain